MKKKVVLLDDSITQGLGSKKINFTQELQEQLGNGYLIDNMAFTGTTIHYAEKILPEVMEKHPEYVVIVYGNVDAQIRPCRTGRIFSHLPKRFQGGGMLMPRPFYSHTWYKRIGQKIENMLRKICSKLIYAVDGTEQWVPLGEFQEAYQNLVKELKKCKIKPIVCSTVYIDETIFPGSLTQYKLFNSKIEDISNVEKIPYLDLFSPLKDAVDDAGWNSVYCFDHFHPNGGGYGVIASLIAELVLKEEHSQTKE